MKESPNVNPHMMKCFVLFNQQLLDIFMMNNKGIGFFKSRLTHSKLT